MASAYYGVARGRKVGVNENPIKGRIEALQTKLADLQRAFSHFQETFTVQTTEINLELHSLLLAVDGSAQNGSNEGSPTPKRLKTEAHKTDENGFNVDDNGFVIVHTDGACSDNGKPNAKAGCGVWWSDGHELNCSFPASRATNNAGEIGACTKAISIAGEKGVKKLKIMTDSQFTIDCVTKWMKNWKNNGWKLKSGGPVKNEIELKALDSAIKNAKLTLRWQHVPGHSGIYGNEQADRLAREAAQKYT